MRIGGKRASQYTQPELWLMMHRKQDLNGEPLTVQQFAEIKKTYYLRKEKAISSYD